MQGLIIRAHRASHDALCCPSQEHVYWKYLLHLEGIAASYRLGLVRHWVGARLGEYTEQRAQDRYCLSIVSRRPISCSVWCPQLLHLNSLVLRAMESDLIEYYYRSLKPWVHYVPFFEKHR